MRIDPPFWADSGAGCRIWRALLLTLLMSLGACSPAPDLTIENARVRALIPGQDKTVAYMDLRNNTGAAITLLGARSEAVRAMEIHTTRMDDGVMRMRRLKEVEIPAGETVRFEPGGRHLMLFGVKSLGPELVVQLEFADGSVHEAAFARIAAGAQ